MARAGGGGPAATAPPPPELARRCVQVLAEHLERLESLRGCPEWACLELFRVRCPPRSFLPPAPPRPPRAARPRSPAPLASAPTLGVCARSGGGGAQWAERAA